MTYVRDQTSAELRQHMKSLTSMEGWCDSLVDRLWQEVQGMDTTNKNLRIAIESEADRVKSSDAPDSMTLAEATPWVVGYLDGLKWVLQRMATQEPT